jgi:adenosylcobinamide-GDP ribazoletransferase
MPAASVRAAAAAVAFLTRIPVGRIVAVERKDVERGGIVFPAVGACLGAVAALAAVGLHERLSATLSAALGVALVVALTGAFHVDALADTVDGLGAVSRERALEIMRDSRIGGFGATAIALDLVVRTAALAQLLDGPHAVASFVAAGALARAAALALAATLAYAQPEPGRGSVFASGLPRATATGAVLLAAAIAVGVRGLDGAVLVGAAVGLTVLLGLAFRSWLGGVTGDALGATTEATETLTLVAAAALG